MNITKIADSLNNYFSNIVTSLKIPDFKNIDNLLERISGISKATLMSVVKYLKHPSIKAINKAFPNKYFSFSTIKLIVCPINNAWSIMINFIMIKKTAQILLSVTVRILKENAHFSLSTSTYFLMKQ